MTLLGLTKAASEPQASPFTACLRILGVSDIVLGDGIVPSGVQCAPRRERLERGSTGCGAYHQPLMGVTLRRRVSVFRYRRGCAVSELAAVCYQV